MRRKAELVEKLLREGNPLPKLLTTEETIERLADAEYCQSGRHQAQGWLADRSGASLLMRKFEYAFISQAARRSIPIHCEEFDGPNECVRMVHSQYGPLLGKTDWAVLGRLGELAKAQVSVHIRWGGNSIEGHYRPDVWFLRDHCPF